MLAIMRVNFMSVKDSSGGLKSLAHKTTHGIDLAVEMFDRCTRLPKNGIDTNYFS